MSPYLGLLTLLLIAGLRSVNGNTEIVNFASRLSLSTPLHNISRYELDAGSGTSLFSLDLAPYGTPWAQICGTTNNCAHEILIKLNPEKNHRKVDMEEGRDMAYMLRISSTPSPPADFDIEILTPKQLSELFAVRGGSAIANGAHETSAWARASYARVRARDAGVRSPPDSTLRLMKSLILPPSNRVDFHLILDPLIFGFIPKSIGNTIIAILAALALGLYSVRFAKRYLDQMAQRVLISPNKE